MNMTNQSRAAIVIGLIAALLASGCSSSSADTQVSANTTAATAESTATEPDTTTSASIESSAASGSSMTTAAVEAANALIDALDDDQVNTLSYEFGDQLIATSWSNLPACERGRAGLAHGDLSEEQLAAVYAVVESVLSDEGSTEYRQIVAADEELGGGDGTVWDADCYFLAFFGSPSTTDDWALQFGGHHYMRTIAFTDGDVTITPAFTGVEPSSFTLNGETVEPLGDEASAIFAIFSSLDDEQLSAAQLNGAFDDVLLGPGDDDAFPTSEGVTLADLSEETQELVLTAIRAWVDDFDPEIAAATMAQIGSELDATFVGWAASTAVDAEGAYTRIDGPSVWIEFINQSGVGGQEIHHHSVYRDKVDDYGTAA